jgi:hypothetical protein
MPSKIRAIVFSEPSGRLHAFVMFAGSLVMLSIYIYYDILRSVPDVSSLVMAVGFALSGLAESLPTKRRRMAGRLRVAAILLLTGLLGLTIVAPDVVLGTR